MKKILFCFGTRPEAIKMAPLIKYAESLGLTAEICLSGQHRDMVLPFMKFFEMKATYNLDIMKHGQSLSGITSSILNGMENILDLSNPDIVIVQGDTTTTFASALAAFYRQTPVAHIEAGLRTGNIYSPFPEEANRKIVSSFANYFFPPTQVSLENLKREGITENTLVTGNTSIDALKLTINKIQTTSLKEELTQKYQQINFKHNYILLTAHRRENLGEPLERICRAIKRIVTKYNIQVVFPVHLNPKVQDIVRKQLGDLKNITLLPPLEYTDFVFLMSQAHIILTDSGGVQEEAPFFKRPILVLREDTERPEGITAGVSKLVGSDEELIFAEVKKLLNDSSYYDSFKSSSNPYGDGHAAKLTIDFLVEKLKG